MSTQEIINSNWKEFFHDFSRFHKGWIASLDVFSKDFGAQRVVTGIPLEGVMIEAAGNGGHSLILIFGETPESHLTHTIHTPTRIWFECLGENELVHIEAENDVAIMMSFHRSMLPAKTDYGALRRYSGETH
jgi:hypothetical protein